MKVAALILAVLALAACRNQDASQTDNRILFDLDGCAFFARPGVGDTTFLKRLPDADEPRCARRGKVV
ncbi:hypothetical protein [Burkholderia mayonis]|uniref:Lipoprotein n=1 Tax=Burkholderia mayonis TaxID=1385591 RepID=A0A1B4G155_9BURK|nr:hypothetical protein [Burkholderia mayonis]AOJ09642.1 hypothetical protein WS71_20230 [Burkholderia mayonis]KVE52263.1 hypothetical protein WS71_10055 [Burkholderia mayonis]